MSVAPIITMNLFIMTSNTIAKLPIALSISILHRRARHSRPILDFVRKRLSPGAEIFESF